MTGRTPAQQHAQEYIAVGSASRVSLSSTSPASPPPTGTVLRVHAAYHMAHCVAKRLWPDSQGGTAPLVVTAPRRDIPDGFYHTMTHGDELVPAVHQDVLLTTVEQELVTHLQRRGAVGVQDNMLV